MESMYTVTCDIAEDLSGWRVSWQARLGSGRRVITLCGETWYCDTPTELREYIHGNLQKAVQDQAYTLAEALLRVASGDGLDSGVV